MYLVDASSGQEEYEVGALGFRSSHRPTLRPAVTFPTAEAKTAVLRQIARHRHRFCFGHARLFGQRFVKMDRGGSEPVWQFDPCVTRWM